jgi:hypothetical protein
MKCVFCNAEKEAIKKNGLFCAGIDSYTGECTWERNRHRFKPFSEKELAKIQSDEDEYLKQMQGFVDFVEERENK